MSKKQAWLGFWILSLVWGSSYFFIRIGVEQLPPFQLVFMRTGVAAIGLNIVIYARGKRLPTDWRGIRDLIVLGVVNTVIPFFLITWGEVRIESSLASVLQGTAALFTLIVAHFLFVDERIIWRKLIGLLVGFCGVVILAGRSGSEVVTNVSRTMHLLGQLAIVGASFCYALGNTYGRKAMQSRLAPIVTAGGAMTVAAVVTGIITFTAPLWGGPPPLGLRELTPRVLSAALTLGLLNTFVAYLIYYSLIAALGSARTSMVTYVIPVVGILLGTIFLHERVDARLIIAAVMIIGSIAIVNLRFDWWRRRDVSTSTA
ncbi:MAG: EamA family transporter [Caldilineaceae bacterium]|nr:EamA family transporter [Caldilineaceae bacterium]